ncbi:hypothetical protein [Burkholderia vietnamiensis]|uniref:hypothetical protein n=1 Tax=Burkholderia vietnamiensis TaxID=60552 RepID=UPI001594A19B|nr:hypothetical protein [Burkholderia vietnamiensis]
MKIVQQSINAEFWSELNHEIAGLEADSVVGAAVVSLLNDVEHMVTRVYGADGGCIESDIAESMKALAYDQSCVWYFG